VWGSGDIYPQFVTLH